MINIEDFPIIAAVRGTEDFLEAVGSPCDIIFLLSTNILTLRSELARVRGAEGGEDKKIFIHIDMADGIGKDSAGLEYLYRLGVDGIISTRSNLIKAAKETGLMTVQRYFIMDSKSVATAFESIKSAKPDMIEIMPGLMTRQITNFVSNTDVPVIAGGLIETKDDVISALSAGASAISTSRTELWFE